MGTNYDEIKQFELSLHIYSYKHFDKQLALFEEMMELFLEPLNEVTARWDYKEEKSALMFTLTRMFNNYESSRLLLLNGFPEQAIMPMRDAIECMMLLKLFSIEPRFALRWTDFFKEYHASDVKSKLDELEVDCPEYAFYGMLSEMVHPNLLSVASKVTEHEQADNKVIRRYHFGGMNRPTWTGTIFNNLLVIILMSLLFALLPVYYLHTTDLQEWQDKVLATRDKLEKLGVNFHIENVEKLREDKVEQKKIFKKLKVWRIQAELEKADERRITTDRGSPTPE